MLKILIYFSIVFPFTVNNSIRFVLFLNYFRHYLMDTNDKLWILKNEVHEIDDKNEFNVFDFYSKSNSLDEK